MDGWIDRTTGRGVGWWKGNLFSFFFANLFGGYL
jgi:hypothetical protein